MTRLPAVRSLADLIRSTRRGQHTLTSAANYLVDHRSDLAIFQDPDHLALSTDREFALPGTSDEMIRTAKALSHQITALRSAIGKEPLGPPDLHRRGDPRGARLLRRSARSWARACSWRPRMDSRRQGHSALAY